MSIRHVTLIMCEGGKGRRLFNTFTAYHANHSQNIFLEIADRSWKKIIRLFLRKAYKIDKGFLIRQILSKMSVIAWVNKIDD